VGKSKVLFWEGSAANEETIENEETEGMRRTKRTKRLSEPSDGETFQKLFVVCWLLLESWGRKGLKVRRLEGKKRPKRTK